MAQNHYSVEGRFADAETVRARVAEARGQASARGRRRDEAAAAAAEQGSRASARRWLRVEEQMAREQERVAKAMGASLRRAAAAEAKTAPIFVSVRRTGREQRLPGFKRHVPNPLPTGSDRAGWATPAIDRDGLANLTLKVWAHGHGEGRHLARDAMAAKARYVIDKEALAGSASEVIFTSLSNTVIDSDAVSADFESEIVRACRAIQQLEEDTARTFGGQRRVQVFRHIVVALPAGLCHLERTRVANATLQHLWCAHLPYIAAIQRPSQARGAKDARNFHLQIVVGNRPAIVTGSGSWAFATLKNCNTLGPQGLAEWRGKIVEIFNAALERDGLPVRYSALSRAERGLVTSGNSPTIAPAEAANRDIQRTLRALDAAIEQIERVRAVATRSAEVMGRTATVIARIGQAQASNREAAIQRLATACQLQARLSDLDTLWRLIQMRAKVQNQTLAKGTASTPAARTLDSMQILERLNHVKLRRHVSFLDFRVRVDMEKALNRDRRTLDVQRGRLQIAVNSIDQATAAAKASIANLDGRLDRKGGRLLAKQKGDVHAIGIRLAGLSTALRNQAHRRLAKLGEASTIAQRMRERLTDRTDAIRRPLSADVAQRLIQMKRPGLVRQRLVAIEATRIGAIAEAALRARSNSASV